MKLFTFHSKLFSKLLLFTLLSSLFTLTGCHTTKTATQVVTRNVHDTLYLNKVQYDSIFITQDHYLDRSKDTIVIKNNTVEYRYRLLRDTIYKSKTDSIPVIKEVTVTQEVERPLTWFDKLCRWCFYWILIAILIEVIRLIIKHRTSILSFFTKIF